MAAARQVSGAFTAPVVDADADASRPWMATVYIPGADLGTHVRDHGPLLHTAACVNSPPVSPRRCATSTAPEWSTAT